MKTADYIIGRLASFGVTHAFGITGSAVASVFDSFTRVKNIRLICTQHEQGAAMMADAYARVSGKIGVAIATSGPGAMNLITGIGCSWFDSIPCLFLTGQVNSKFTKGELPVRQVGFQETDIVSMVKTITKYAVMVKDPLMIRYELEKALYLAVSGRPGPVLIDLPMDVQAAKIDVKKLIPYSKKDIVQTESKQNLEKKIRSYLNDFQKAKRPVVLVGGGVVHAKAEEEIRSLLNKLAIPVVLSWPAIDVVDEEFPFYRGRIGTYGQRGANFTIQNADLLLSLGSRHDGRQTGGLVDSFAREAKRYIVDVDKNELKYQQVKGHINIHSDLKNFLPLFVKTVERASLPHFDGWLAKTKEWQKKYQIVLPKYRKSTGRINGYAFMELLSAFVKEGDIIVSDCGGNLVQLAQTFKVKKDQRIITPWAHSPMGSAFVEAIGVYLARKREHKDVICAIGDGGMQVNIQELQTMKHYKIPLKVFVINNNSYGIIKQYQDIYLNSRYVDSAPEGGYTVPDFSKIARAYGIATETIQNYKEAGKKIKKVLQYDGSIICDVKIQEKTELIPRLGWNKGIEDQWPYLNRQELLDNLYIKPLNVEKEVKSNEP